MAQLCHAAASGKKNNTGRGPKERCRSVPRGTPSPFFFCFCIFRSVFDPNSSFFAPKPHGNLATQAIGDRESSVALYHGVALKKKMIGRRPRERYVSFPRFGIDNALQDRKERKAKGYKERAESGSLYCFN